ncbi:MAG: helicase-associated domain-containing protein [Rhodoluna sp.]|nr:helicase-associated domain-containing protein [Rhodoluna sp.]
MSQVLDLAGRLRALSDDELVRLLRLRGGSSTSLKDFFDLAEWLLQPKHMATFVNSLPKSALAYASGAGTDSGNPLLDFLREGGLVTFESGVFAQAARPAALPIGEADSVAGIHAFETLAAITELVFDLEHRILRDVGKQGISLADTKRIAALTGKELDFVRAIFELAAAAGLITSNDGRWSLTTRASEWVGLSAKARWQLLAATWLELLGAGASAELGTEIANDSPLDDAVKSCFPLERFDAMSRFGHVIAYAELLGLSVDGAVSSWTSLLLAGDSKASAALISKSLPTTQSRIIIQGDLSVIAPGPLSTEDERELRAFVDIEQAGLASRYRLSALSVSFGMESGLSAEQMRATLQRLAGTTLPQPVDYLLNDAVKRFGRIRVIEDARTGGCFVMSKDATLLTELVNDSRLKPYNLIRIDSEALSSRFARDILYFGLREVGHTAIRSDKSGAVVSPLKVVAAAAQKAESGDWVQTVARLRQSDQSISSSSDDESIMRQILLAIKSKAKISVTFIGQNDVEQTFVLEPNGVANGRMRARDRKADIERTIPIANISAVSFL